MSRFEDEIVRRKRAERKRRQTFLRERIGRYRMARLTVEHAYQLFRFFDCPDPSDGELMVATQLIEAHIADEELFRKELEEKFGKCT